MKCTNKDVKRQCTDYNNIIKLRIHLQKLNVYVQRFPHPAIFKQLINDPNQEISDHLKDIQEELIKLFAAIFKKVKGRSKSADLSDTFGCVDLLPARRHALLERLDDLNNSSAIKVDRSFQVLNDSISNHVRFFLNNTSKFINKSQSINLPNNIIGYNHLKDKCDQKKLNELHSKQLYNDQAFYIKLLNHLLHNDPNHQELNIKKEELLLRNLQESLLAIWTKLTNLDKHKSRLSLSKVSKGRKVCYKVIDKLQNFVERTSNKEYESTEFINLLINSLFKA